MFFQRLCLIFGFLFLLPVFSAGSPVPVQPSSGLSARNYLVMDAHSGAVLAEQNPDERVAPASLVKIMTAYLVFQELKAGKLRLDEEVAVSERAWRTGMTGASRMYIDVGSRVTVEDLLRGMIVQSGNDACVALAERLAGTEEAFVDMMNAQARSLGLENTRFQNSHGLPSKEAQYTSARDIVTLARFLILNFQEYYGYYSERSFTYNNITQHNRNRLPGRDSSVDGVKTGWTKEAGYNLVTSAKRDGMRLVSVVMGIQASSGRQGASARAKQTEALLNWAFRQFETVKVRESGVALAEPRIWKGVEKFLPVGLNEAFYLTIPRGKQESLQVQIHLVEDIQAPVAEGRPMGELHALIDDERIDGRQLVALKTIEKGGIFRVFLDTIQRLLGGLAGSIRGLWN
ncbi:MAG TPA: D-alanyl-D-alanine carboxypeptidase [Desulfobacteraceae bacterium]|nr:D-alanyl-D-alanine carboxypeptidase [Desulfobacteraceae bacterium]